MKPELQNSPSDITILVVDDEPYALESLVLLLEEMDLRQVETCLNGEQAIEILKTKSISLILLDIVMPVMDGAKVLEFMQSEVPDIPVIIISGSSCMETALEFMRKGAYDFITKPVDRDRLQIGVKRALEFRKLKDIHHHLTRGLFFDSLRMPEAFKEIITNHNSMRSVFQYCEAVATSSEPILIHGETGVGKELIARALHEASGCRGPFVAVNLAGVDGDMFSDTLFGHIKGAFTGALRDRVGLIERAENGTLFLDEIGDLDLESQIKLLRVLQEKEYYRVGVDLPKTTNARIVCATNQHLWEKVADGSFRKDLYYRLRTYRVHVPPLRDRPEDIPLLIEHFVAEASKELKRARPTISEAWKTTLAQHTFPGNVRELRGIIYESVAQGKSGQLADNVVRDRLEEQNHATFQEQPPALVPTEAEGQSSCIEFKSFPTLQEAQSFLVHEALRQSGGVQKKAAAMLGITPSSLNGRLKRLGL